MLRISLFNVYTLFIRLMHFQLLPLNRLRFHFTQYELPFAIEDIDIRHRVLDFNDTDIFSSDTRNTCNRADEIKGT